MQCSKETLVRLFYNLSSSFLLLSLFFYFTSILLAKLLHFCGTPILQRNQDGYDFTMFSEEEEEESGFIRNEYKERDHLVAEIIHGGESPQFLPTRNHPKVLRFGKEVENYYEPTYFDTEEDFRSQTEVDVEEEVEEEVLGRENIAFIGNSYTSNCGSTRKVTQVVQSKSDSSVTNFETHEDFWGCGFAVPKTLSRLRIPFIRAVHLSTRLLRFTDECVWLRFAWGKMESKQLIARMDGSDGRDRELGQEVWDSGSTSDFWCIVRISMAYGKCKNSSKEKMEKTRAEFTRDENFLIFAPPKSEAKKKQVQQGKDVISDDEIFGDSCTVGSTSKSSSEWRSSINCRDSGTDDPFSSSSRRSCPKWESYTVFQKYDEEMLFLDRISAQKLHETESLRSIQACPRSVSERIVYKLSSSTRNKKSSYGRAERNPYHELEAAYVAQICLTWEALNWNYKYFQRLRASRRGDSDPGCPAYIAQQFQQFQVLLQRYVENEPYEHGRRPEIYARIRSTVAPKLLQVPEYRDSIDGEESVGSRIPSDSFVEIMEESIRTFMNFLKADRESHRQILAALFRRNRTSLVDPTRLLLFKKLNKQKKMKLKDLRRTRTCLRRRRLKEEEEMEILMALIDTKVVSRVLRMKDITEEQLQWCDDKMRKVRVADGKMQRDSSPLFFPAH